MVEKKGNNMKWLSLGIVSEIIKLFSYRRFKKFEKKKNIIKIHTLMESSGKHCHVEILIDWNYFADKHKKKTDKTNMWIDFA